MKPLSTRNNKDKPRSVRVILKRLPQKVTLVPPR